MDFLDASFVDRSGTARRTSCRGADLGTGAKQDDGGGGGDLWTEAGRVSSNRWADSGVGREILEVQASGILCEDRGEGITDSRRKRLIC
jgi:hypothetical protein